MSDLSGRELCCVGGWGREWGQGGGMQLEFSSRKARAGASLQRIRNPKASVSPPGLGPQRPWAEQTVCSELAAASLLTSGMSF